MRYRIALSSLLAAVFVLAWPWLASPAPRLEGSTLLILAVSGLLQLPLWLAIVALIGRPICSLALLALGLTVVLIVNGLNYRYTGSAMVPVDFFGAVGVVRDFDLFRTYIMANWIAGLCLVGLVVLIVLGVARERPIVGWGWKALLTRVAVVVLATTIFVPPTTGTSPAYRVLSATGASFNGNEPNVSVARNGLFAHLVTGLPELVVRLPEQYGEPAVLERALAQVKVPGSYTRDGPLPHIVVILEESFFDARRLDVSIDPPILTRFDAVASRSRYYGQLLVPVVGGGTVESEFSFLTGLWTNLFRQAGKWPFQTLVTDRTWTIARYLDSLGYETVGLYPHPGSLFGGQTAYRKMGFHRLLDVSVFEPGRDFAGQYVKDEAVSRKVIEIIKTAARPTFVFALTMENHGPWGNQSAQVKSQYRFSGNLRGQNLTILEDYVARLSDVETLVEQTDRALGSLGVPVVFAVFGDHLPALFSVFEQIGFTRPGERANRKSSLDWFRTPYFVATYPPAGDPEIRNVDVSFLSSLVLDAAGLNQDSFFRRSSAYRTLCYGRLWACGPSDELSRAYAQVLYDRVREEWRSAKTENADTREANSVFRFGSAIIPGTEWLGAGWAPEAWGAWTVGPEATVVLRFDRRVNTPLTLVASVSRSDQIREAEVLVNGNVVAIWKLDSDESPMQRLAGVPVSAAGDSRTLVVTFRTAQPRSPKELTGKPDERKLGLAFRSLTVCVQGWTGCPVVLGDGESQ